MRSALAPLAEREFRLLFLGRTVSFIGSAFATTALAFAVLDVTGSKADLGYVLAARAVPQVVFLPRTDCHDSRRNPRKQPLNGDVDRGLPPPEIASEDVSMKRVHAHRHAREPCGESTKRPSLCGVCVNDLRSDPAT